MKTLQDLNFKNKKVLLRVDFNVPMNAKGEIVDDTRIKESLPTFNTILKQGGTLVLMGHMGRPKGPDPSLSLSPCAQRLSELMGKPVSFVNDCIGDKVHEKVSSLKPGDILLLENLRFYPAEEKPALDPSFATKLGALGDLYVDDAFGSAHRAHTSIYEVPKLFPEKRAAGLLMEKEYNYFHELFAHPKHPFFAIIGGGKIGSKFGLLNSLIEKVDSLFVGGGMAFTLLKAQGVAIGDSLCDDALLDEAKNFLSKAKGRLILPKDNVIVDNLNAPSQIKTVTVEEGIPAGWSGVDIGPLTLNDWKEKLFKASTVFWNGPLGVYEIPPFEKGTHAIASVLASLSATTVVGGGDSLAAIHQLQLDQHFSHLSTGGGACLEFLELGHLPGIDILES